MRLSPTLIAVIAVSGILGAAPRVHAELLPEETAIAADSGPSAGVPEVSLETAPAPQPALAIDPSTAAAPPTSPVSAAVLSDAAAEPAADALQISQPVEPQSSQSEPLNLDVFAQGPANPTNTLPTSPDDPATPAPAIPPTAPVEGTTPASPSQTPPTDPAAPTLGDPEQTPAAPDAAAEEEPRVLVSEVDVVAPPGEELPDDLAAIVYDAVETSPGRTTTRTQLQQDINSVFATGFFSNVRAVPEDTPLGVRVTFVVQPNPVLQTVRVSGNTVLPQEVVDEIFSPQYGEIINLIEFQDGILALNEWYQNNGYVLAQVVAAPAVSSDGIVTLEVAEGVVEDIRVRFLNAEGETTDEEGNPIRGRTRDFIITREFNTQPGAVFNQQQVEQDLQRVFGLGIFDDIRLSLEPGQDDPRQVDVVVNVTERNTGSVAAGLGFNFTGDLFGTVSYRQDNFGGNNQKFSAEAQLSSRDLLFDVSFTDPWIGGDPYRTSYTVDLFARRAINLNFDGGPIEVNLPNGDDVRVRRIGTGISFSRPLGNGWTGSLGTQYQNVSTRNFGGGLEPFDERDNPLTQSAAEGGSGVDDLWTINLSAALDQRNDSFNPTSGSLLRLSTEQSIPLGGGSIFMNRVRAGYSYYIPVSFINFSEGPQALAFNVQAGTVIGELPPYEAFSLGGTNSVRGYDEGAIGSGRNYIQATVEYRFPLFSFLGGAAFIDAGTDLGSGFSIPGAPGPTRGKPGSGLGYGLGLRVQTPLGPLRIDYGLSINGGGRLHFGIGERF